ncbi:MAG: hypothetical protein KDE05_09845 [Parvularculaceae bacterium]|nr:hypothetical protein [Parvularculaceae bacterium]
MAQSFVEKKRIRKSFGRIGDAAPMPNLIQVQKDSYEQFLQRRVKPADRHNEGLEAVFRSVFPIMDFTETAVLEFVSYEFEEPKYDVEECQQRDMTYAAPLKVTLRLAVFDVDEETGAKSIRDVKEQEVYMGDIPLMTDNGTFIINGTERVIVSQMHRSPGVFFDHDRGKTHSSGKLLFAARIIPYRGSWLDFEFDAKDIVNVRIDRRRKLPATTLLYALGMDQEEILDAFFDRVAHKRVKDGWTMPFRADRIKGVKLERDLINAKNGEVAAEAGKKLSAKAARDLAAAGLKELLLSEEEMIGRYFASDLVNFESGEIYAEAGDEISEKTLKTLEEIGIDQFDTIDVDHLVIGAYMRNTLSADKNSNREQALIDIYRVMRPGEPPTLETAESLFYGLFFDPERYDLSAVGRVKMNIRLEFETDDTMRTLRKEDILKVLRTLTDLRDGRGEIDDIDNLGNRRVRSVGELMENQYRIGLLRMERAIKERMSSQELDTLMPHDLINAKPAAAAVREFFGSSV